MPCDASIERQLAQPAALSADIDEFALEGRLGVFVS